MQTIKFPAQVDAYSVTCEIDQGILLTAFLRPGEFTVPTKPRRGFCEASKIISSDRTRQVGSIHWGGLHAGLTHMEILGPRAADFMRLMRERYVHHCTRIDVAHDYEGPNAFQELNEVFEATKTKFDVYGQKAGDWDQPRFGLTRTSSARPAERSSRFPRSTRFSLSISWPDCRMTTNWRRRLEPRQARPVRNPPRSRRCPRASRANRPAGSNGEHRLENSELRRQKSELKWGIQF